MTDIKQESNRSSWPSPSVIVTLVFVVLCLGEFVRVELLLKEHVTRIRDLESKVSIKNRQERDESATSQDQNVNPTKSDAPVIRVRRNALASQLTDLIKLQRLHASVCNVTITDTKCRAGPPGPPGRPGFKGEPGSHGYHGNTGPRGPRGEKGEKGSSGTSGLHGNHGIMGPPGPQGRKGDTGMKGEKGERGEKGEQGPKGTSGSNGNPGPSISSPHVIVSPSTLVINEGQTAIFNCLVRGYPQPVVGWSKLDGSSTNVTNNGKLVISNVRPRDAGTYECQAKNFLGTERKTVYLAVNYFTDCSEIYESGERQNGVYTINPDGRGSFQVYCDMTTDGGGWTVFQRRKDGSVDFYRDWNQYKTGFGNLNGEFWLGNDKIHRLSSRSASMLRVDLEDWDGTKVYAKYGYFRVDSRKSRYGLTATSYSGTAGDAMNRIHNKRPFTTKDNDNDTTWRANCAVHFHGAWWYQSCYDSNLNGKYSGNVIDKKGIVWTTYKSSKKYQSLKFSEMKVKRIYSNRRRSST